MKVFEHDHRDAADAISPNEIAEISKALGSIFVPLAKNGGTNIRGEVVTALEKLGWSGKVKISPNHNLTVTGMKGGVAACVQFGNVSRSYADLLKLQALYERGKCDGAIFILPTKAAADAMASNLANADRLVRELELFRSIINIPIKVLGVE